MYAAIIRGTIYKKHKVNDIFSFYPVTNIFHSCFVIIFKKTRNQQQSLSKPTDLSLKWYWAFALCFPWGLNIGAFLYMYIYEKCIYAYINEDAYYNLPENSVAVLGNPVESSRQWVYKDISKTLSNKIAVN